MNSGCDPVVSVIVPARNEEACLGLCVESLIAQTGINFEIIVVDDASTDRTAEIARSFSNAHVGADALVRPRPTGSSPDDEFTPDVTLIAAPPLQENWTGKNNAMSAGVKITHAKAKWLLFTDADTFHKPDSLARAVAEAEQHGAALLSYSPEQEVRTFWEKAVMPVIFAELASTYPPKKVNDPASPIAAANGQYLLISREAYDALGGHTKIASDLLEDVAMARLVKFSGRKIFFRYGGDAVRTRMYRSFAQLREGWTKNLALLFPKPTELALERIGEFILPPVALYMVLEGVLCQRTPLPRIPAVWQRAYMIAVGSWVVVSFVAGFVRRIRKAHFPCSNIVRTYFGLPVFAYLLLRSNRAYKKARFEWKDRSYIYSAEEIRDMTHAPSRGPEFRLWDRVVSWVAHAGRE